MLCVSGWVWKVFVVEFVCSFCKTIVEIFDILLSNKVAMGTFSFYPWTYARKDSCPQPSELKLNLPSFLGYFCSNDLDFLRFYLRNFIILYTKKSSTFLSIFSENLAWALPIRNPQKLNHVCAHVSTLSPYFMYVLIHRTNRTPIKQRTAAVDDSLQQSTMEFLKTGVDRLCVNVCWKIGLILHFSMTLYMMLFQMLITLTCKITKTNLSQG